MDKESTSEQYYYLLEKEFETCFNPYQEQKHLTYVKQKIVFKDWCSHQLDNGQSAIEIGIDDDTSESWSQCKLCNTNFG